MKRLRYIIVLLIFFSVISVSGVAADVNEILTFTNFTDEKLYVELAIFDDVGGRIYEVFVSPDATSIADYWADTSYATYSACAYGVTTDDFYGCIEGGITDYNNNIYFDYLGEPYLSAPSDLPTEVYVFENPYQNADVVIVERDSHHSGCFIGGLLSS